MAEPAADITRRSRAGDDRPISDDGIVVHGAEVIETEELSPEDALAEAQKQIVERDARIAQEREAREAAERRATEATRTATEATVAGVGAREAAIDTKFSAAESAKKAANTALRAAREANDLDAEMEAQEQLAEATAASREAKREKEWFAANKERFSKAPTTGAEPEPATGPTAESRKWLDEHPRFDVDPEYQSRAIALHNSAQTRGIPTGSKQYVDFINDRLTQIYGDNHGSIDALKGTGTGKPRDGANGARRSSSTAAPPSRSTDGGSMNGSFTYTHSDGSKLSLVIGSDGKETVQGRIPAEWVEAASWNGYKGSDGAVRYAIDQMKIQQEMQGGSLSGLASRESGVYR